MFETSKAMIRRLHGRDYVTKYFVGKGLDIGSGNDSLAQYTSILPLVSKIIPFDKQDGDAHNPDFPPGSFDFIHSSHCLEHLVDPVTVLANWLRLLKPGGYLIVLVPDEDLYEKGVWPSRHNGEHKNSYTIYKLNSWCPVSINVLDLIQKVSWCSEPIKIELLHGTSLDLAPDIDQTMRPVPECAIEFILRKK